MINRLKNKILNWFTLSEWRSPLFLLYQNPCVFYYVWLCLIAVWFCFDLNCSTAFAAGDPVTATVLDMEGRTMAQVKQTAEAYNWSQQCAEKTAQLMVEVTPTDPAKIVIKEAAGCQIVQTRFQEAFITKVDMDPPYSPTTGTRACNDPFTS